MNKSYDNFIFDLYGTIIDIHTNEAKGYLWQKISMFFSLMGANYEPTEFKRTYKFLCKEEGKKIKNKYKEINLKNVFRQLFALKNVDASEELVTHSMVIFRTLSMEYFTLYPGAYEMLKELKQNNKKVFLLSNAQYEFTLPEMKSLGIDEMFDKILISSDYGVRKPSEEFYKALTEEEGLDLSKSIMIGNDIENDIEGAQKIGLDTFYIHSNISPKEDILEKSHSDYSFEMNMAYNNILKLI